MPDVWPFIPMPESQETLVFNTDIQRTYDTEMRYSLRGGRQYMTYRYRLSGGLQKLAQKFRNNPTGQWLVPVWEQASSIGAVLSTDTAISADPDAEYDGLVLIFGSCDNYVTATVSSVTSTVNLSAQVGQAFSDATAVPLRTCVATNGANLTRLTRSNGEVTINWLSDTEFTPSGTTFSTYGGYPYLACSTAVLRPLSGSVIQPTETIDSDLGPVVYVPVRSLVDGVYAVSINLSDRAEIADLRKFLGDMRGQDDVFWIADWEGKLNLTSSLSMGATSATITPLFEDVADYVGRYVLFNDEYKQIDTAIEFGGDHQIGFTALSNATSTARMLRKVRLNTDRISFGHRRGLYTAVDFTVREAA